MRQVSWWLLLVCQPRRDWHSVFHNLSLQPKLARVTSRVTLTRPQLPNCQSKHNHHQHTLQYATKTLVYNGMRMNVVEAQTFVTEVACRQAAHLAQQSVTNSRHTAVTDSGRLMVPYVVRSASIVWDCSCHGILIGITQYPQMLVTGPANHAQACLQMMYNWPVNKGKFDKRPAHEQQQLQGKPCCAAQG